MKRREFIGLLGGAVAAPTVFRPLVARAQQPSQMRQVGILLPTSASDPEWQRRIGALTGALRTFGWVEGQTVTFIVRHAEGRPEQLPALVSELVAAKVDVIVVQSGGPIEAARRATSTIPI